MRPHKRATHRKIFRSLIHEAIKYPLVYLPRSSSTKATAEPPSHSLLSYIPPTFFKHYGHCRAGEPLSHIYLVLKALKPLASRRATLLYIYFVLKALKPLPSRRAAEPLSYIYILRSQSTKTTGEPPSHSLIYLPRS